MPKDSRVSKALAAAFVVLTVSVIAGIVIMVIFYNTQIAKLNPTPRPTFPVTTTGPPPVMRLPTNLVPHSYDLVLWPRFYTRIIEEVNVTSPNQTMLFTGNSTVYFQCVQSTRSIYLHSKQLTVSGAVVMNRDANFKVGVSGVKHHEDASNFLEIQLNDALGEGGNYSLFLAFEGEMSGSLDGMFPNTYVEGVPAHEDDKNVQRYLVGTHLQPTYARKVFPCFDEPQMKAVFHVTIIHRTDTTALGNAEKKESDVIIDEDWRYTTFQPTPKMSTYLLAFAVSEFTPTPSSHGRVTINTYARPQATEAGHLKYAAAVTAKILQFFEDYFEIDYKQKKLDQIALPDLSGAMENWGLVTYHEGILIYEEGVSSLLQKDTVTSIVAHELAHQWFGNLVTMKWWNETWLNEGFATYMSHFAMEHAEPSFKLKAFQVQSSLQGVLSEDALASSHAVSVPQEDVQTSDQITEMFSVMTYEKGAALLRMLADVVDERVFNEGVKMYLKEFQYKNTDQNDLWKCIQKAEDKNDGHTNVAKVMTPWTNQIGFPVITINTTNGEVTQKHFLYNHTSESSLWWYVPIRVMSETTTASLVWMESADPIKRDAFISKSGEWILANVNSTGYYRVNYNPENWERLLTQLQKNPNVIPLMNRGQLIDDAFNLARAKVIGVNLALNATRFLRNEKDYLPWETADRNLKYFVLMFDRTEVNGPMQVYLREQVRGLYNFFSNYTNHSQVPEDHSMQHNQILAINIACKNGLPECQAMATKMFAEWMNSKNSTNNIHPNLRSTIYCQALAAGGKKEWEFLWNKFQKSSDPSERQQFIEPLACTRKIWLLNRYLEYTLDPDKIRLSDIPHCIGEISNNVVGQALVWNFIRAHWEYVSQGDGSILIWDVTRRFSTPFELSELQRFSKDYDLGPAAREVQRAIEQTQVNIEWVSERKDAILEWFENETAE